MYSHWGSVQVVRPIGGVELLHYPSMTTALDGGEGSASRPGRSLPPRKTRYTLYRRLGRPHSRSGQVRKMSPTMGFDPRTVQPVASRYIEYATRPTSFACRHSWIDFRFRWNWCKQYVYVHPAVVHLWISWKSVFGRPYFSYGHNWNYTNVRRCLIFWKERLGKICLLSHGIHYWQSCFPFVSSSLSVLMSFLFYLLPLPCNHYSFLLVILFLFLLYSSPCLTCHVLSRTVLCLIFM